MRNYDFNKAKRYIQMHSDLIENASMGMHEDWFWTGQTVYENGRFLIDLEEVNLNIGGIAGSGWATPVLEVEFKDGTRVVKNCFVGDADSERPDWFSLGCLSAPISNQRTMIEIKD